MQGTAFRTNARAMKRLRVYLSSTFEDLKAYRAAVFNALEKAGLDVARMEAYTAADDVWHAEHLAPFLQLDGPRLLVTTRIRNLVEQVGQADWQEVPPVDEMGLDEAAALLGRGLSLDDATRDTLRGLADQLGCWPLLLDLTNARLLEERRTRREVLAESIHRIATLFQHRGVLGFDRRDSSARNAAVARSVEVGLELAEAMFHGLANRAAEISIFPEDVPIPVRALADLWQMAELDVEEEVERPLDNLSLVRWHRDAGAVQLHDMLRRALEARLSEPADVHRRLIDAWGHLHRLPHDYALRWVCYQLAQAKEIERLRAVLLSYESIARRLRASAVGIDRLIGDYDRLCNDPDVVAVQRALRQSAHILIRHSELLEQQLIGRVSADSPVARELLDEARRHALEDELLPKTSSLRRSDAVLWQLGLHRGGVSDLLLTDDGRGLSVGVDGHIYCSSLAGGASVLLVQHEGGVLHLLLTGDGRVLSGGDDGRIYILSLEAPIRRAMFAGDYSVSVVAFDRDRNTLVAGDAGGGIPFLTYKL